MHATDMVHAYLNTKTHTHTHTCTHTYTCTYKHTCIRNHTEECTNEVNHGHGTVVSLQCGSTRVSKAIKYLKFSWWNFLVPRLMGATTQMLECQQRKSFPSLYSDFTSPTLSHKVTKCFPAPATERWAIKRSPFYEWGFIQSPSWQEVHTDTQVSGTSLLSS